jgi:protocatechuate 3,4-dioxygenase beta subunit
METTMIERRSFIGLALGGLLPGCARAGAVSPARPDLYHCDGCEAALERSPTGLASSARMARSGDPGEPMILRGTVRHADSDTPAANVIVYAYQTNAAGLYADGSDESRQSRRHGRLRAWARTGGDGRYSFDTIKPAPYPDHTMPAHVHLMIAEPGRRPYYLDQVVFAGEFGVTPEYRARQELRGGSGITRLRRTGAGQWLATRDIVLERHP